MPSRSVGTVLALLLTSSVAAPARASSVFLQDQSAFAGSEGFNVSAAVIADDIDLPDSTRLDSLTVWLFDNDGTDNGALDDFDGTLSWAIYSDSSGPDTLLFSGFDTTPQLTDTGLQSVLGSDVVRARIDLSGQPVVGPGKFWLVLHEGLWGSAEEATQVFWAISTGNLGIAAMQSDSEQDPGSDAWFDVDFDVAFALEGDAFQWNQGGLNLNSAYDISSFVQAVDLVFATPTRLASADVWLTESALDGDDVVNSFDGTLSWAIYTDDTGFPGTLLESGEDTTVEVTDSGEKTSAGQDISRARVELAGDHSLAAGTYWLALHEGAWGSSFDDDGTKTFWMFSSSLIHDPLRYALDETAPGDWQVDPLNVVDLALVLFEDELFASGFEAGVTCAWSTSSGGATCP